MRTVSGIYQEITLAYNGLDDASLALAEAEKSVIVLKEQLARAERQYEEAKDEVLLSHSGDIKALGANEELRAARLRNLTKTARNEIEKRAYELSQAESNLVDAKREHQRAERRVAASEKYLRLLEVEAQMAAKQAVTEVAMLTGQKAA